MHLGTRSLPVLNPYNSLSEHNPSFLIFGREQLSSESLGIQKPPSWELIWRLRNRLGKHLSGPKYWEGVIIRLAVYVQNARWPILGRELVRGVDLADVKMAWHDPTVVYKTIQRLESKTPSISSALNNSTSAFSIYFPNPSKLRDPRNVVLDKAS
jgi:hypothetical protein